MSSRAWWCRSATALTPMSKWPSALHSMPHPPPRMHCVRAWSVCVWSPCRTYTEAPYEKGFAFVSYLRACVGSDEAFDAWLHTYTSRFAFASISAVDMLECFFDSFPHLRGDWSRDAWIAEEAAEASSWWNTHAPVPEDLNTSSALPALPAEIVGASGKRGLAYRPGFEFMRWLHAPGWPAYYPDLSAAAQLSAPAEALAAAWLNNMAAGVPVAPPASAADFRTWPALQQLHFLDTLVAHVEKAAAAKEALAPYAALVHALDDVYNLSASGNAEIRLRWSQLIAGAVVEDKFSAVVDFLHMTGKLKYQTPVFRALVAAAPNAAGEKAATRLAVSTYATVRETLHPAVQSRIDGVFKGAGIALSA
ncbi:hypothetical protein EON67_04950 [archaeon]|nr:MAG: hypothetical protein EON67_04950 [archaeon]